MAKKTLTKPAKGTRDFLPEDIRRREYVTGVIREVYEAHGFVPLETPTFERLETLLGKYGDEGDQLVFKILHRGQQLVDGIRQASLHIAEPGNIVVGRSGETAAAAEKLLADMGLRYDLTVPLARVYAEYPGKLPAVLKRYQIQPVWRADTPGKGRFREFYQCDVDVVGSPSQVVEAEVTGAVAQCLERLGFEDYQIRLNHRALLRALIEVAGIDVAQETEAIVALDKLDKVGAEGVLAELEAKGVAAEARQQLLDLVLGSPTLEQLGARVAGHEGGTSAVAELQEILRLAAVTPAGARLCFDPTLARGLGYYTGAIFEIQVRDLAGSLGGGGRYDGLIGMFSGKDVPACGFSIGLERILVVMEQRGMFKDLGAGVDCVVAATEPDRVEAALQLSYQLRQAGLRVELSPKADKPGKVRKAADERGVPWVVLVTAEAGSALLWSRAKPEVTDDRVPEAALAERMRG